MSKINFHSSDLIISPPQPIEKEMFRNSVLPVISVKDKHSFLGWKLPNSNEIFMNFSDDYDVTLEPYITDEPSYIIESHYRGDVNDYVGKRCHYRRYVIDVYLENAKATSGEFKIDICNDFLYYLGHIDSEGIKTDITAPSRKFDSQKHFEADNFQTDYISVKWSSDEPTDAINERKKIIRIMLYFSRFGLGYSEIAGRTSDNALKADQSFNTTVDNKKAHISANFYTGFKDYEESSCSDFDQHDQPKKSSIQSDDHVLSRFALMADSHIGLRYNWENYNWLYSAFDNIKKIHTQTPLDFIVQLGDNIDDGYASSYKPDYDTYLDVIRALDICDPVNPIEDRAEGKIPHYELQGNHDTSFDTRFFRRKMWHTENALGEKVYYISFFSEYGGYPLVPYEISSSYESYRSYGNISDETADFIEKCAEEASKNNAAQIVLFCHFGIAKELFAPILPETGLSKIVSICKKHNIKLYFNGHEHNKDFSLYNFNGIYDYDAAMTSSKYAIVEIRKNSAKVTIYNSEDNTIYRVDNLSL